MSAPPRLHYADSTHTHLPADAAVVEDLTGGSLEDALARDPEGAPEAMERMAELLATLHSHTGPRFGKVAVVDNGGSSYGDSCEQRITEGALRSVAEAAAREPRAAAARRELEEEIHVLAAEVRPRDRHTLVLGELEGLMYFDVEHEHVFLRLRFGPHSDALRPPRPGRGPSAPVPPGHAHRPGLGPADPDRGRLPAPGPDAGDRGTQPPPGAQPAEERLLIFEPSHTSGSYLRSTARSFSGISALSVILMPSGQTSVQHLVMLQ